MAREVYDALDEAGIKTFFAGQSLAELGTSRFRRKIDDALDECSILIVVGTSKANIESEWVEYEWGGFLEDILSGEKQGEIFSYIGNMKRQDLPRSLKSKQFFVREKISMESIVEYVKNAIMRLGIDEVVTQEESKSKIQEKAEDLGTNKLLQFANRISAGKGSGDYINPYISEDMTDLIAKKFETLEEYDAETCMMCGLEPVIYEVFLAQKIARINDPESCAKAFDILNEAMNSWHVFLNENHQVVAYWIFIALEEEAYERIKTGQVDEKDISLEDVQFIDMPGRYKGYLLLAGTIKELRTPKVVKELYSSWLKYIQTLAEEGIFFDEISTMVASAGGNSSLKNIGMKKYAQYISGGNMFKYDMKNIQEILYLKKEFPQLAELYRKEYDEKKMEIKIAALEDIVQVTELRMTYLKEAYGGLSENEEKIIRENNIEYLKEHLNKTCFIAFVRKDNMISSCGYLNIMEKAANLRFMNNVYGEIYGVYTLQECRKKGMATELIKCLVEKGRELKLPFIKLDASEDGYPLYEKIGFRESNSDYREMKYFYTDK